METWANYSYTDGIRFCNGYTVEEIEQAKTILQMQNLTNMMMTGYSVEGLPYKYEGSLTQISYSQIFYDVLEEGYLTPASYIMRIIRECNKHFDSLGLIMGIVGRGLRSLPAFLREMDLPNKLVTHLTGAVAYRSNPEGDIIDHTDVYLEYQGECYHIWSYQSTSERALINTISKLRGDRGELLNRIYILCPFNYKDSSQYKDVFGWRLYYDDYVEKIKTLISYGVIDDYANTMTQGEEFLKQYIKVPQIFRKQ